MILTRNRAVKMTQKIMAVFQMSLNCDTFSISTSLYHQPLQQCLIKLLDALIVVTRDQVSITVLPSTRHK